MGLDVTDELPRTATPGQEAKGRGVGRELGSGKPVRQSVSRPHCAPPPSHPNRGWHHRIQSLADGPLRESCRWQALAEGVAEVVGPGDLEFAQFMLSDDGLQPLPAGGYREELAGPGIRKWSCWQWTDQAADLRGNPALEVGLLLLLEGPELSRPCGVAHLQGQIPSQADHDPRQEHVGEVVVGAPAREPRSRRRRTRWPQWRGH